MLRLIVVGAGAIGGTIAAAVENSGFSTGLVTRPNDALHYREHGLSVQFPDRQIHARPEIFAGIGDVDWRQGDVAVVATKLNDAQQTLDELKNAAGGQLPVVCASNGIQGEAWALERFEAVFGLMIWMPSTHMQRGDFRVYGKGCPGILDVGTVTNEQANEIRHSLCLQIASTLAGAGFDSVQRNDIMRWKYAKLVTNVGNTAQALVIDDWKAVAALAREEAERVLTVAGIDRVETDEFLKRCKSIALAPIDGQKREGGSTWQSLQRGKPLETPWIEGAIVDIAKSVGQAASVNQRLNELAGDAQRMTAADILEGLQ